MPHPISKWPTRPRSHSLYPGYKSGLRTPVQCWFSLALARCSNSISHSNKLYSPLLLPHIWKFFSNPCPDHDSYLFLGVFTSFVWSLCAYNNIKCNMHFPLLICCQFHRPYIQNWRVEEKFSSPIPTAQHLLSVLLTLSLGTSWLHLGSTHEVTRASLIAQLVKNPPAMQETRVQFLGWEDPLEWG